MRALAVLVLLALPLAGCLAPSAGEPVAAARDAGPVLASQVDLSRTTAVVALPERAGAVGVLVEATASDWTSSEGVGGSWWAFTVASEMTGVPDDAASWTGLFEVEHGTARLVASTSDIGSGGTGWLGAWAKEPRDATFLLVAATDGASPGVSARIAVVGGAFDDLPADEQESLPDVASEGSRISRYVDIVFIPILLEARESHGVDVSDSRVTTPAGANALGTLSVRAAHDVGAPGITVGHATYHATVGAGTWTFAASADGEERQSGGLLLNTPNVGIGPFAFWSGPFSASTEATLSIETVADALPRGVLVAASLPLDLGLLGFDVASSFEASAIPPAWAIGTPAGWIGAEGRDARVALSGPRLPFVAPDA